MLWNGWPVQISSAECLGPPVTNDDQAARRPSMYAFHDRVSLKRYQNSPQCQRRSDNSSLRPISAGRIFAVVLDQGLQLAPVRKNQSLQR
ncbi:hypothetical protein, partial [Mesorhizobium sp. M4B.F.Ca.ET.143.01.1.1]|uniref:hypothetical protein n=1 Tax=Mesorhizobium sp. M4B.F.Ca.ET.143.01.1.1 TaxID=2563947 RepID=UPI001AEEB87C